MGHIDLKKTNILIIYPWDDVLNCSCGATLRLSLLVKYLKSCFDKVTVLYPNGPSTQIGNVKYIGFKQTVFNAFISRAIRKIIKLFYRIFYSENPSGIELYHIWHCFRFKFDRNIKKLIGKEIKNADIVIMKYFYFSSVVFPGIKKEKRKIIVADYDVVAEQAEHKHIKKLLLKQEIYAFKKADVQVVLSDNDKKYFEKKGIENIKIIYNGIDTTKASMFRFDRKLILYLLRYVYNISIDNTEKVCFFIGSGFIFNLKAAQRVKETADRYCSLFPDSKVKFITCGACHPVSSENNFLSIGISESLLIHLLYLLADIVLIPLEQGTGSSLKTAEAFSYGKLIIGTNIAFRGIHVSTGENCIISDDILKYPYLINKYMDDSSLRRRIEEKSFSLGKQLDYRNQNKPYLDIFNQLKINCNINRIQAFENINLETIKQPSDIDVNLLKHFFSDSKKFFNLIPQYIGTKW